MNLSKRQILFALAALGAGAAAPALAQDAALDLTAGRPIGEAFLAIHPNMDRDARRRELLPNGPTPEAIAALRTRVSADYEAGRVFNYRGWKLSETEGRLFALLV